MQAALEALFNPLKEDELPPENEFEDIELGSFPPELVDLLRSEFQILYLSEAKEALRSEPKRSRQQTYEELIQDYWKQTGDHVADQEEDTGALQLSVESEPAGIAEPMRVQSPTGDSVRGSRNDPGDDAIL